MSYLVLARKWRPKLFEEVIGQEHVTKVLQNAIKLERVAHAYIFSGPRGVGKTSVARILAKALNCKDGPTPTPCCSCSNCIEIGEGRAVDVIEIDGASNRGIDNIRNLQESIGYKPVKGLFKVYIIDEVHMLTVEAFNALLKTLEEPPRHVHFVMATTEPHRIPSTVLSRCQHFDFRRINARSIVNHLDKIAKSEGYDLSSGLLEAVALEADGSLRDSQTLLEQVIAFYGEGVSEEELLNLLGIVDRKSLMDMMKAILDKNLKEALRQVEAVYSRGLDEVKFLQRMLNFIHNLLIIYVSRNVQESGLMKDFDISEDERDILRSFKENISLETIELYYQILLRGVELARKSSQPHLVLEMTVLKMANVPRIFKVSEAVERLEDILKRQRSGKINLSLSQDDTALPSREREDNFSFEHGEVMTENICKGWKEFLQWVSTTDPTLFSQIQSSRVELEGEKGLTVYVLPVYEDIMKVSYREKLKSLMEEFFKGRITDVKIGVDGSLLSEKPGNSRASKIKELKKEIENHPMVKEFLGIFDGSGIKNVHPFLQDQQNEEDSG